MFKKYLVRGLIVIVFLNILFLGSISIAAFIYKEEIKSSVLTAINSRIKKPISIKQISVSVVNNFPGVTFSLHDVFVPKCDSSGDALCQLKKVEIVFDALQILQGNFVISKVEFIEGKIDAIAHENGLKDFEIWNDKTADSNTTNNKNIVLTIEKVRFKQIEFSFLDECNHNKIHLVLTSTISSFNINSNELIADLKGIIHCSEIRLKPGVFFKDADLYNEFNFNYSILNKQFSFKNCSIESQKDIFIANGSIDFMHNSVMNLGIKCNHANINNIFNLLPSKWKKKLDSIAMDGNINADAIINVSLLPDNEPYVNINFATSDFQIQRKGINKKMHDLNFKGNLTSTQSLKIENYKLTLTDIKGEIDKGSLFESKKMLIENFIRPSLYTAIALNIKSEDIFDIIKFRKYDKVGGRLKINLLYNGYLNFLSGIENDLPDLSGTIELINVNLKLKKLNFPFDKANGFIHFHDDSIYVNDFLIQCGKTDMNINGNAFHLFNSVFNDTTGLKMHVDFTSNAFHYSDFNFFSPKNKRVVSGKQTLKISKYQIILPYNITASVKGKVKNFYSKNYIGNQIELDAHISSDTIKIYETMNTFGGQMKITNLMMPNSDAGLDHRTLFYLKNVQVSKVFKAFNNFNQTIITSDKINGILSGIFNVNFKTDGSFKIDTSSFFVKGTYSIKNILLNHIEPIMKLSKLGFKENDLDNISCKEISSELTIDGNQLTIPRTLLVTNILYFYMDIHMTIGSNSDIFILLPVKNLKKRPNTKDLTNDSEAGVSLPIKISGRSGNMKVTLLKRDF